MFQKIFKLALQHKIVAGLIIILAIIGGYYGYKKYQGGAAETRYVLASVEKGTLITSVSGSGQVLVSNQVDIKSKVSGDAVYVGVKNGQEVKTGALLAQIDSRDAQKAVRDAETALETAKLELEELLEPADAYSLMQAENALIQAKDNLAKLKPSQERDYQSALDVKQKAQDDLEKTHEEGFNAVANAFLDLPAILTGLHDILLGYNFSVTSQNMDYYVNAVKTYDDKVIQYRDDAYQTYQTARAAYNNNFNDYKSASRLSETKVIESLISQTYETTKTMAEAVKSANNLIQFYKDKIIERSLSSHALADTHLSALNTHTSKTNTHLNNLSSIKTTIKTDKETITNAEEDLKEMEQNNPLDLAQAERTIKEKEESLAKLKAEPDKLDIRAKKIVIQQKEDSLLDARQNSADYFIRAPFDGVIAEVNIKKGDSLSGGAAIATLITTQQIAEVSLNEVDVAKIKVGQKATLTFDAVEGLSMAGEVIEIDTLGNVSQGVVNYNVKIGFGTQDERVKPGMSVGAAIITDVKQDVLMAPNSAVKSQGGRYYVERLDQSAPAAQGKQGIVALMPPRRQLVEIGLANDTSTEIVSGLKEGDQVVSQTITATASASQSQSGAGLRIPGIGGGGDFRR